MSQSGERLPFRLGLIGLGIMGVPMARRLLAQGWTVTVWNLEPERFAEVEEAGARWADSVADLRKVSDVVLVCVLGDEAVESVCLGENGLSSAEGADVVIDLSTTGVEATRRIADTLGMEWLDCPISGGPAAAEDGKLTLMAGGSEALFERVRPILDDLSGNVTLMGPLGAGQTTKIINQAIVGVNYVLMGELLAQVEAAGIAGDKLAECLKGGLADSVILQRVFPLIIERRFEPPTGRAKQLDKDLQALQTFNDCMELDLPVQAAAVAQYHRYVEMGFGEWESASVSRLYNKDSPGD